jgi:hypothetical protein
MKFKEFLELNALDSSKKANCERIEKAVLELKRDMGSKKDKINLLLAKAEKVKQEYSRLDDFLQALQHKLTEEKESKKAKEKAEKK